MSDALTIAGDDVRNLAAELVEMTGESLESVVETALRERFERVCARREWQDRIMVITREIAMGLCEPAANDRIGTAIRYAAAG
jgi:hypothetical protein